MKLIKNLKQLKYAARKRAKASRERAHCKFMNKLWADNMYYYAAERRRLRDPSTIVGQIVRVTNKEFSEYKDMHYMFLMDRIGELRKKFHECCSTGGYHYLCIELYYVAEYYIDKYDLSKVHAGYYNDCLKALRRIYDNMWDYMNHVKYYDIYMEAVISLMYMATHGDVERIVEVFGSYAAADKYPIMTFAECKLRNDNNFKAIRESGMWVSDYFHL